MTGPLHVLPTAPLAERVLLPGDPGRALLLAQSLLEAPRMFNHNRGLWGYTGTAADGAPLTIQTTGIGGPSAGIVIFELAGLGAKRLIRVGTCGALDSSLALGDLLIATEAIAADGTSRALGATDWVAGSPDLIAALQAPGEARSARVASTDLFYEHRNGLERQWASAGAVAVEMETATLFAMAAKLGLRAGSVLIVSDLLEPRRVRIDADVLQATERRMGELAARALLSEDQRY